MLHRSKLADATHSKSSRLLAGMCKKNSFGLDAVTVGTSVQWQRYSIKPISKFWSGVDTTDAEESRSRQDQEVSACIFELRLWKIAFALTEFGTKFTFVL